MPLRYLRLRYLLPLALAIAVLGYGAHQVQPKASATPQLDLVAGQSQATTTFFNPITHWGADPFVVYDSGYYYLLSTTGGNVTIWKSQTLEGFGSAPKTVVYTPSGGTGCCNVWAPELHKIAGTWYIYYTADNGGGYDGHRMYVLQANTSDPLGSYTLKGKLYDPANDYFAIDGTVLQASNGNNYLIWSGGSSVGDAVQKIYIMQMSNPWTLTGSRTLLSTPTYSWETVGGSINEGPDLIQRNGKVFILYNASGSWTDSYATGMLTNTDGNYLTAASWTKASSPIFSSSGNVYGPGIGNFVKSPDGTEDWLIYHAERAQGTGWDRNLRLQKFTYNADDSPNFGTPVQAGVGTTIPSGEPTFCTTCNTYYGWGGSSSSTAANGDWMPLSNLEVRNMSIGSSRMQIFQGSQTANYTASVSVKADSYGSSLANPRYGMYAAYLDANNYVTLLFDQWAGQLSTEAVIGGVTQAKQNTAINITYTAFHTLSVTKSGSTFTFYLDGTLEQTRTLSLATGQLGLITEDVIAEFRGAAIK